MRRASADARVFDESARRGCGYGALLQRGNEREREKDRAGERNIAEKERETERKRVRTKQSHHHPKS